MDHKCPHCSHPLPEEARFCMHCMRYTLELLDPPPVKSKKHRSKAVIFAAAAAVIITTAIIILTAYSQPKTIPTASPTKNEENITTAVHTSAVVTSKKTKSTEKATEIPTEELTDKKADEAGAMDKRVTEEDTTTSTHSYKKAKADNSTSEKVTKKRTEKTEKTDKKADSAPIIKDGVLIKYPDDLEADSYTIPHKVKSIKDGAFSNKHLKSLYFSDREKLECDYEKLFSGLPSLQIVYIYPGTTADKEGKIYFSGEIVYL